MANVRKGIYGASGYAGQNLVELLANHPKVDLVLEHQISMLASLLQGQTCATPSDDVNLTGVDAAFLELPDISAAAVGKLPVDAGKRVIDLSADICFDEFSIYV